MEHLTKQNQNTQSKNLQRVKGGCTVAILSKGTRMSCKRAFEGIVVGELVT